VTSPRKIAVGHGRPFEKNFKLIDRFRSAMLQDQGCYASSHLCDRRCSLEIKLGPITAQLPLSTYERTPLAKENLDMAPSENRTKAVERRMIYVIPRDASFSLQELLNPRCSAGLSERRVGHPVFKNSGLRSATKCREYKTFG